MGWPEVANALDGACYSPALAAEFDRAALAEARSADEVEDLREYLIVGALVLVDDAELPDEERARLLARMALDGVPARTQSFAPPACAARPRTAR